MDRTQRTAAARAGQAGGKDRIAVACLRPIICSPSAVAPLPRVQEALDSGEVGQFRVFRGTLASTAPGSPGSVAAAGRVPFRNVPPS